MRLGVFIRNDIKGSGDEKNYHTYRQWYTEDGEINHEDVSATSMMQARKVVRQWFKRPEWQGRKLQHIMRIREDMLEARAFYDPVKAAEEKEKRSNSKHFTLQKHF